MPSLLAYALLFTGISAFFIFSHLMLGKLVRPARPDAEKKTIYECGEPTIGSSWIQFDLRFYVVALLFVIFDVEMAFFFPWAVVFGKANQLSDPALPSQKRIALTNELGPPELWRNSASEPLQPGEEPRNYKAFKDSVLSSDKKGAPSTEILSPVESSLHGAGSFAWTAFFDIIVFFGVLLVGFAYLWRRGDLDWVRSMAGQRELEQAEAEEELQARKILVGRNT